MHLKTSSIQLSPSANVDIHEGHRNHTGGDVNTFVKRHSHCAEVFRYTRELVYVKPFTPRTVLMPWSWSVTHQPSLSQADLKKETDPLMQDPHTLKGSGEKTMELFRVLAMTKRRSQVPHTHTWQRPSTDQARRSNRQDHLNPHLQIPSPRAMLHAHQTEPHVLA